MSFQRHPLLDFYNSHYDLIVEFIKQHNEYESVNVGTIEVNENTGNLIVTYSYKEYGKPWAMFNLQCQISKSKIRDIKIENILRDE